MTETCGDAGSGRRGLGPANRAVANGLKRIRRGAGVSVADLEKRLLVGAGWVELIESGAYTLTVDLAAAIAKELGVSLETAVGAVDLSEIPRGLSRRLSVTESERGLILGFPYGDFDATYLLEGATLPEFETFHGVLRAGLLKGKTDAVAGAFVTAVRLWPTANPADLWNFALHHAYCDVLNHPPVEVRRDFEQSWKRTGGWALERVLVEHYGPRLAGSSIRLEIPKGKRKAELVAELKVVGRVEADKVDVFLVGSRGARAVCFGAVHVKASFAERRTDDVPLSQALIAAGYASPLWTLDLKAVPGPHPVNRGELGVVLGGPSHDDGRSAKRKDIEEDGYFSACFSYNTNTIPTPDEQDAAARVYACGFGDPDDAFAGWIEERWARFA
jgi:transcriptional regulator with XRE-family HTH domain